MESLRYFLCMNETESTICELMGVAVIEGALKLYGPAERN